jgi:glycosyltransferase involved in cell wall biosynthesis
MIVAIDGTPAIRERPTGTEVYARSVIEAMAGTNPGHILVVYANAASPPSWLPPSVHWRGIPFPRMWTHLKLGRTLRRERPDVLFVPSHVLPVGLRVPSAVTIHDVGHRYERSAYSTTAWLYLELTTRYMARRASRLIAVSQTTANDLHRLYGVDPSRIAVVHSGIDELMRPPGADAVAELRSRYELPDTYYLFVGRNHPRKNLPVLLRAFAEARRRGLAASLVVAGPDHAPPASEGVMVLPYIPHQDLPALYAGAIALTLPSRYEGFGFPVLEAMRCGTAVIASRAGALPEIVGSAGILLSPTDVAAWSEALLQLAQDLDLQRRLIAAGRSWSARFTWRATAEAIWPVLESIPRSDQAAAASR